MRHHALPDAALADLAAGRPSPETLDELRRAQLGKHMLLLRAIVQAVPHDWYADLLAADPGVVRPLVADPLFGAWAAGCLAALTAGASPAEAGAGHLAELAAQAAGATTAGAGAGRPAEPAVIQILTATHAGLTISVRLEDSDPVRARLGLTPAGRQTEAERTHWQSCLDEAWRLLVERHRPAAETLAAVLAVIVPVEPDPAAHGISATSAHAFGAVAMSAPDNGAELAVGLLHETQHSLLNAVTYLFDLHSDPALLGYSPWRDDPRPAAGILHGAYAYLAVARFWRAEAGPVADFEFARWRAAVCAAADGLLTAGGLTPVGARFAGALRDEVRPWLDEPVAATIARLAAGANTDHYLRWRLRNRSVDPAAARTAAHTWLRGDPLSPPTPTSRLIPAPRRALEHSDRLALTHHLLREPAASAPDKRAAAEPGPGERLDGDLAYLAGDDGAARAAYTRRVETDAGDDAAWAGLALVSPQPALRATPEIVAAVFRELSDPAVTDIAALAEWISGHGTV